MNPFGIAGSWRIDPDNRQDRGSGQVTSYKLSPEEIDRIFSQAQASKKESGTMKALEIDVNKLLEVCRMHGTGNEGYRAVAKKFGITEKQAESQIYLKKIRRLLNSENQTQKPVLPPASDIKESADISICKPDMPNPEHIVEKTEAKISSAEDELFDKIKSIIKENKQLKAITAENEALRNMISSIHGKLQEIISDIKKGGQIE